MPYAHFSTLPDRWPGWVPSATLSGAMALDPPSTPRWPRDARAACAFTFDLDAETLWMARGIHEPVTLSQGRFGPVEALPRILTLLRTYEIRASFFIPAWVSEPYQDAGRALVDGGHEIGCHGDE